MVDSCIIVMSFENFNRSYEINFKKAKYAWLTEVKICLLTPALKWLIDGNKIFFQCWESFRRSPQMASYSCNLETQMQKPEGN